MPNANIVIWGGGVIGREYICQIKAIHYCCVTMVVDSRDDLEGVEGIGVVRPNQAEKYMEEADAIVIAIAD